MVLSLYNFSCLKRFTALPLRLITMSHPPVIDYKEKYEASLLQIEELQGKLMQLTHQLAQLKRMIFGT